MAFNTGKDTELTLQNFPTLAFSDIIVGEVLKGKVVQGTVANKGSVQTRQHLKYLRIVLKEDKTNKTIPVYMFDDYIDQANNINSGDRVYISNACIEKNMSGQSNEHECQIKVDPNNGAALLKVVKQPVPESRGVIVSSFDDLHPVSSNGDNQNKSKLSRVRTYSYTQLKSIGKSNAKSKVNVYGIVKFFKEPYKSRGTDYNMLLSLTDDSFVDDRDKLKCMLFNKDVHQLPAVKHIGDIVRFHRLSITEFKNEPQGNDGPGFSWLVFSADQGDPVTPRATSSPHYIFTDADVQRVKALRKFKADHLELSQENRVSTFSAVTCDKYFDVYCQVIATCRLKEESVLLRVWDGTKINLPVMKEELTCDLDIDEDLLHHADGYIYDVKVFDDHVPKASTVRPGDFVKLRNLHAAKVKSSAEEEESSLPTIELCLHRETKYLRGLDILPEDDANVKNLKLILNEIPEPSRRKTSLTFSGKRRSDDPQNPVANQGDPMTPRAAFSPHYVFTDAQRTSTNDSSPSKRCKKSVGSLVSGVECVGLEEVPDVGERVGLVEMPDVSEKSEEAGREIVNEDSQDSVTASQASVASRRCMQTSATVLTEHHHVKICRMRDVIKTKVPNKYRLRGKVVDLQPKTDEVEDFVRLYCNVCHYVKTLREMKCEKVREVCGGVKQYNCPQCAKHSTNNKPYKEISPLEYIYMLQLILKDSTGWLTVQLWRDEAIKFFNNIEPRELLEDKSLFNQVQNSLKYLLGHSTGDGSDSWKDLDRKVSKPWVECCLKSYSTPCGVCYQVFDTMLCDND